MRRAAGFFDGVQAFGFGAVLLALTISEAAKSIGLGLAVVGFVGKLLAGHRPKLGSRSAHAVLALYLALAALSVAFADGQFRRPEELVTLASTLVLFPLALDACRARPSRRVLFVGLIIAGATVAALLGYAQAMIEGRLRLNLPSVENPIPAAEYLGAALAAGVGLGFFELRAAIVGPLIGFSCGTYVLALLMTKSRGPLVGAVVGTAAAVAASMRRRYALLLVALAIVALACFARLNPESRFVGYRVTGDIRVWTWSQTIDRIRERPLLGHGLGSFSRLGIVYRDEAIVEPQVNAHNVWLNAAAETGILGCGALSLFLVIGIRDVVRAIRRARGGRLARAVGVAALAASLALVASGLFSVSTDAEPGMLLFALLAIGAAGGSGRQT